MNAEKVAAALLAMETSVASRLLSDLPPEPLARVSEAMAKLSSSDSVDENATQKALEEFAERLGRGTNTTRFQSMLQTALGNERASELLERSNQDPNETAPFGLFEQLPVEEVAALLSAQGPQVTALAMSRLSPALSAKIVTELDDELRPDVMRRLGRLGAVDDEVIEMVAATLLSQANPVAPTRSGASPTSQAATILNHLDSDLESAINDALKETDEDLFQEIDELRLTMDELAGLPKRSMQKVLGQVDGSVLSMALKKMPEAVSEAVLSNLSKRAKENILEERDLLGPVPATDVENAHRQLLATVRELVKSGEVILPGAGGTEIIE